MASDAQYADAYIGYMAYQYLPLYHDLLTVKKFCPLIYNLSVSENSTRVTQLSGSDNTYELILHINDIHGASTAYNIQVHVTNANDTPPSITSSPLQNLSTFGRYSYTPTASDIEGVYLDGVL